jgi:hypothetical protein
MGALELLARLDAWNARTLNASAIGRELGVTRQTVSAHLRSLERDGRVLLLRHYQGGRRFLLYLPASPIGACACAVASRMRQTWPEAGFFWWMTGRVRRIDLLAVAGEARIGFQFCAETLVRNQDWWPLRIAHRRGIITRGFLLYPGDRAFMVARAIQALPYRVFFSGMEAWLSLPPTRRRLWRRSVRSTPPTAPARTPSRTASGWRPGSPRRRASTRWCPRLR